MEAARVFACQEGALPYAATDNRVGRAGVPSKG